MKQKQRQTINLSLLIVVLVAIMIGWIIFTRIIASNNKSIQRSAIVEHVSSDLKISLEYPSGWYIDDRYQSILLTSYKTSQNKNDHPSAEQIEIYIREFSNCFSSIEEDLQYPACGERKEGDPNKITFKEKKAVSGGEFYKYITRTPTNEELVYYLLERGDRLLRISKQPDPSQFEKEFEEIVNSIKFLN